MTDITDNQYLSTLQGAGDPPASAAQALQDPNWAWLFEVWAQEPRVGFVNQVMAQLARMCVDPSVSYMDLRMEAYVGQRAELYSQATNNAFNDMDNEQPARQSLLNDCAAASEAVWPAFRRFILIQQGDTDAADAALDWNQVYAAVDAVNQPTLKGLQPGESVNYWQQGGLVLLGENHDATYYDLVGGKGSPTGTVTMSKKGGFLDTGKIAAYNSPDPAAFDEAIARFSKKTVVHGQDFELEEDEDGSDGGNDAFGGSEDLAAFYDQCAQTIAAAVNSQLGLSVSWTGELYANYRTQSEYSAMRDQWWREAMDAAESAGLRSTDVWEVVEGVVQQNGW